MKTLDDIQSRLEKFSDEHGLTHNSVGGESVLGCAEDLTIFVMNEIKDHLTEQAKLFMECLPKKKIEAKQIFIPIANGYNACINDFCEAASKAGLITPEK